MLKGYTGGKRASVGIVANAAGDPRHVHGELPMRRAFPVQRTTGFHSCQDEPVKASRPRL